MAQRPGPRAVLAFNFALWMAASAAAAGPTDGAFRSTGDLTTTRNQAAATLLAGGSVLVFGPAWTADVYDATSGAFTATGAINVARPRAAAYSLSDGGVIVLGGTTDEARAERYVTSTRSWVWGAAMGVARSYQQTARLLDGRILVAGGRTAAAGYHSVASAEIYDPVGGTFRSIVAAMPVARSEGVAETLPDGRVLLAGGLDDTNTYVRCATLFDPAHETFVQGACFVGVPFGLDLPSSVPMTDGRVLVSGGWAGYPGNSERISNDLEVFDPQTGQFSAHHTEFDRLGHTLTQLPTGEILVAGGVNGGGIPIAPSELLSEASLTSRRGPTLVTPRYQHTATGIGDGRVLITGGETSSSESSWTAAAELYEPDRVFDSGFDH